MLGRSVRARDRRLFVEVIMIENEFKIMLTENQYEELLALYDFKTIVQTNHYYDTEDLQMSARHITVRVRELGGKFFLQMKLPTEVNFSRVELSRELEKLPETLSGKELTDLSGTVCPSVKRIGTLKTTRGIWKFDGGELDLDRSEYFDKTDYEMEIEFTDERSALAVLSKITQKLGVSSNPDVCIGKVKRFIEEYKKSLN